ncbi:MAG: 1-deoxy-D-xylulose-5-phosphate synthase [bacterium]|nr:1-deoxy-D-xylulose-5-phosphate synthase [bacterium]
MNTPENLPEKATLLDTLNLPGDLKHLCKQDMEQLAQEIRNRLKAVTDDVGGHLASNLGVVEITLALHSLFESPKDKFIWDVSHQCYVHKMLTGRLNQMFTIKQYGGLSGFAKAKESEHDIFGAGHASTALSAGLGLAQARDMQGEDHSVISIVGDGSLSGGMCYEAINNIDTMKGNFICILNDNDMSISPPVGSMANYITSVRTSPIYNFARNKFERIVNRIPGIGEPLVRKVEKVVDLMRNTIVETKAGVLFEEFGFKYLGPLDGHNISVVMGALKYAKSYPGPIMIHLITTKGKGLSEAEADPVKYHGVSPQKKVVPADANQPNTTTPEPPKRLSYTQVFGKEIINVARTNPKVCVITPAMREGSGLVEFEKVFPERYFDVGIAEEHAVTFAGGVSKGGMVPVLAIYSTFLQRGFDQLIHDVCLQELPMVLALDRAGLVGADGPTHHGVFDYSFLNLIPNMVVCAPKDGEELRQMLNWSVNSGKIVSIRYPRGSVPAEDGSLPGAAIELGKSQLLLDETAQSGKYDMVLLAAGTMAWPAHQVGTALTKEGHKVAVINLRFTKPLDEETILHYAKNCAQLMVLEEGNRPGGVHSAILQLLHEKYDGTLPKVHSAAIADEFANHGTQNELLSDYGLQAEQLQTRCELLINDSVKA